MGILRSIYNWLAKRNKGTDQVAFIQGPGTFTKNVVGESYYQANLERICGKRSREGENKIVTAALVYEDDNPKDRQAVRVDINGLQVGYLSRQEAREYREGLAQVKHDTRIVYCKAVIRGGWRRGNDVGHYGVKLDIPV